MNILDIRGLTIETIRGEVFNKHFDPAYISPAYILFTDKKTIMELREQDGYEYHDCSPFAREITVSKNAEFWGRIFEDKQNFPEATTDF